MSAEKWKPVAGCAAYTVSSLGRIYSTRRGPGRELGGWVDKKGYRKVFLYNDAGRRIERFVHCIVAEAFHGPRPTGMDTRHLNGDKTCNEASNLRWGSRSENELDKVRHGTHQNARKTHCKRDHPLSGDNVRLYRGERVCRACARDRSIAAALRAANVAA